MEKSQAVKSTESISIIKSIMRSENGFSIKLDIKDFLKLQILSLQRWVNCPSHLAKILTF